MTAGGRRIGNKIYWQTLVANIINSVNIIIIINYSDLLASSVGIYQAQEGGM